MQTMQAEGFGIEAEGGADELGDVHFRQIYTGAESFLAAALVGAEGEIAQGAGADHDFSALVFGFQRMAAAHAEEFFLVHQHVVEAAAFIFAVVIDAAAPERGDERFKILRATDGAAATGENFLRAHGVAAIERRHQ